ncbi:unnamed protein product [Ceutorhynchus assimilis]|uniref:Uncharacterized protein n=1 Tax=Ceutorhynchus assimilis TaxID=467358 RepID=A0A9N9QAY6_9CUCU|nr:unnamed protein product [Ceutorhynchus assimilis]
MEVEVENLPRRSLRLALSEINERAPEESTPSKTTNVEELLVLQRGPRKIPITWSPVEYNRTKLLGPPRDKTPEPQPRKSDIHPRLRRRLIMSPEKNQSQELGHFIAKKLKNLQQNLEAATVKVN